MGQACQPAHLERMLACSLGQRARLAHELEVLEAQLGADGVAAPPEALQGELQARCERLAAKILAHTQKVGGNNIYKILLLY